MGRLCAIPLILDLMIGYWRAHDQQPRNLPDLFEAWLDRVLLADKRYPSKRDVCVRALMQIAKADGLVRVDEAIDGLRAAGIDAAVLDELAQRDAIDVDGQTVSFSHESQRDYLRALDISRCDADLASRALARVALDAESLLPVLLMQLLPTPALKRALWNRMGEIPLPLVAVTLSFVVERRDGGRCNPEGLRDHLDGMISGIDLALDRFFPQLRPSLTRRILRTDVDQIRVIGEADEITYLIGIRPRPGDEAKVEIGKVDWHEEFGRTRSGRGPLTLSNGHADGLGLVASAAVDLIKRRDLPGRGVWYSERASSWLRALASSGKVVLPASDRIPDLLNALRGLRGERIYASNVAGRAYVIDSLCRDLEALLAVGVDSLPGWTARPMTEWDVAELPDDAIPPLVDAHYRRVQLVYRELVEEGFLAISPSLGHYNLLPVRAQLEMRHIEGKRSAFTTWLPVADWDECGADIVPSVTNRSVDDLFDALYSRLRSVGRDPNTAATYVTGWGPIPAATGYAPYEHNRESVCIREACQWLRRDIEALFRELPEALRHHF